MKIKKESLLKALQSIQAGLSARDIIEQSSCFVFNTDTIHTYNDEVSCCYKLKTDIKGAVVSAPLISLLSKLQEEDIEILQEKGKLIIKGHKKESSILMDDEILLPIDAVESPEKWKTLPDNFCDAVSIVQNCAGTDENETITTCVHITPSHVECLDNFQIAKFNIDLNIKRSFLVRKRSLSPVLNLGVCKFALSDNWIHFKNKEGLEISCKRFCETFPDTSDFFDVKGAKITIPKTIKEAAQRASIFSNNADSNCEIKVILKPDKIKIIGKGIVGEYKEYKKIKYKGETFSFNIAPANLIYIIDNHNECTVNKKRLKVAFGKYQYVTSVGKSNKKESE